MHNSDLNRNCNYLFAYVSNMSQRINEKVINTEMYM